ncbi:hypothetical protein CDD83_893 [Cordyceps sp. RAO-2017]|nr:hypothetical protein CDD83_893 [Cordyceps sp. RAO-2017]
MRFVRGDDKNVMSKSILPVGVGRGLRAVYWDEEAFLERGGVYDWTREDGCGGDKALECWLGGSRRAADRLCPHRDGRYGHVVALLR